MINYGELFQRFLEAEDKYKGKVMDYKPWGRNSIVVYLIGGEALKVKYRNGYFYVQEVSKEDIAKHYIK